MAVVVAALLPVFLLIVLGFTLKRSLMRLETQWNGLERLTYFVLFPTLLIQTLVKADLSKVPVAGVGGALFLSALVMSLLCLALRPLLARFSVDGPAFTSIFRGATRWQTYVALAAERSVTGFVLGLPINMDGSEGPRAQSTRAFARNLAGLTTLTIGLWDERLSTAAVERELIGMDVSRAKRAEVIDEHAAIFILQGALDRLTTLRASGQ